MICEIEQNQVKQLLIHQLNGLFLQTTKEEEHLIDESFPTVWDKLSYNFSRNPNKYYHRTVNGEEEAYFNPYHVGQWTIFLYYMSYEIARQTYPPPVKYNVRLADKIYFLNKTISSCDLYHQVELPRIFSLDHPQGSVMGRARYSDGFSFGQYSTVGNNHGVYPVIGKNCRMCMNSAILGNCHIGNNVTIGAGAIVKDQDVPDNSLVFGQSPNLIIKPKRIT